MLIVIGGPMFAGKTKWLLDYAKQLPQDSFHILKPSIDNRYGKDVIASHNGESLPATNIDRKNPQLPEIPKEIKTLFIDELNFFEHESLLPHIQKQLNEGKDIIGAGLMYDFELQPFGATIPLSKLADKFVELSAVCDRCGKEAKHSYRKVTDKSQILVGAAEMYGPCCLTCWKILQK